MFKVYYKMSLCYLSLHSDGKFLTRIDFCKDNTKAKSCVVLDLALDELDRYFAGKLKKFTVPLLLQGTDFELKVYKALKDLAYGQTISYKEIAQKIHHPKAFRAVGNANSKNPIPIIIPCHRVVLNNAIGGYKGGVEIKKFLLEHEKNNLK
ncbi:methylated-DNA--[protein]-cysteine S-methyltransferase [Campylobacter sp. VicNov18]|uniref:methylated-DNA--[protein]-cysteine S-methyltransferase n=1 Tax=Campylobacter bilis TaxID=2691918 RepID=UPI00130E2B21|nr:methylated-DNA--[protein]-cysteine S-methyltransferase [Campylobacter bilis]MPV63558.1 methylated-DNA--[protein]-cysteine S-methyltransferase [Campylobacter hepaticus]MBM0637058.1 methylated-DNA--[protein]-cysteine S-methyltransferase [Campylobacter bilis]MCC8277784.1 methylated-DNA--[protein]-cysteine S-methyltransferase [Campylobacter bilis]MCC8299393.1 methylated-DNA--[protein]-cysteine S-methyltransferase [Campylobacter bilis]MCC8300693.1 methylated-DNA--[protein]-cysteine S-methyltrans